VTLARIPLASGREVELTHLEIRSTYGGMLEGYTCARINDRLFVGAEADGLADGDVHR
jgi:hypothetical protein